MDYLSFCKNYFSATSIPVNLLDREKVLYSSIRTTADIPQYNNYYVPDVLPNCPCFSHYDPSIEYGIIRINQTSMFIVLGPVFETEITPEILNAFLRENKISISEKEKVQEFLCSIPRLSQLQLAKHLIFLHQAINHESCELSHFFPDYTPAADDMATQTRSNIGEESTEYFNTYSNELRLYEIIKMGNEVELKNYLNQTPLNLLAKPLATSALRQAKNMFISTITNIVMIGAIPGGVSTEVAFTLMGQYVQECEKLQSVNEIETLRYNMLVKFCQLSGKSHVPLGVSSDVFNSMNFIRSHTNESITVNDVADHIQRSTSYVTNCFRKELGISPGAYISRCKLEEAKSLLTYTNMSLTEISNYLCYSSQSYFQNAFKKKFQLTPLQYRKNTQRIN